MNFKISRLPAAVASLALGLGLTAAHAGPVTYSGTLGKQEIVVELSGDPADAGRPLAGRYFYTSKGIDIPLQPAKTGKGILTLSEEAACEAEKCPDGTEPPIAATWNLSTKDGGNTLTGSWDAAKKYPIALKRVGRRPDPQEGADTTYSLFSFTESLGWDDEPIDRATAPYDFLRLDQPLTSGERTVWGDVSFENVSDPRTVFSYPRIVSLGGASTEVANAVLKRRHWGMNLSALSCYALQYSGFHEPETPRPYAGGSLAGFEDSSTTIDYLSQNLMSWQETSSIFCGGAHPAYNSSSLTMDVRTGRILGMGDIFTGWGDQPPAALIDFVKARRIKQTDAGEIEFEAECGMDDLIAGNLAARFHHSDNGDEVIFGVEGLPHAIFVCTSDLVTVPVADVKQFLTPKLTAMFPDLK